MSDKGDSDRPRLPGETDNGSVDGKGRAREISAQLEQIEELLQSIDKRLSLALQKRPRRGLVAKWKKLRSKKLWVFEQYPPRPIHVPSRYKRTLSKTSDLSFAIVTPTYQHKKYVGKTIESVLAQSYPHVRYTVQDGGSTDGTTELLLGYGDRLDWRSERDAGQADAINRGFQRVSGDIMAWLNSDDLFMPGALPYVADFFAHNPDVDVVYGHRVYINANGEEVGRCILPDHDANVLKWADYVPQETMFWRRRVWEKVGPLDTTFQYALDWDFILKAQSAGFQFRRLPRFLGCFRIHPEQKTTAIRNVGDRESAKIQLEHLGKVPSPAEVRRNIKRYLKRHVWVDNLYWLGLMRF